MNFLKRIVVTMGASADAFAQKLENQEAVAEGIIAEVEEAVIRVKSELIKTRSEIKRLEERRNSEASDKERWIERARKSAEGEREKALSCARMVKSCGERVAELEREVSESRAVERELLANLTEGEKRLGELRRKKRVLASRQSRAEATAASRDASGSLLGDADDLFSRWEAKVTRTEGISDDDRTAEQQLAQEFHTAEERDELETLLNEITNN